MGKKDKAKEVFAKVFELPQEVVLNLPRISLTGNLQIEIENHRGIIKYNSDFIKVRVYHGQIIIKGEKLIIESLEKDILRIEGKITDLSFKLS
ncbi:sporulation protein YqfC [Orenia marismortui]|uniref:Sporulation protein YqfC n=1 Tax=Orenia marismortui TaxID=46469 RepID=A0A4R8H3E0_9FIRM|nr:sporulation protein YqfC [Orenia marismortui]TDX51067.1 sporulation protein YqfC [Orenia marismortui]